MGKIAVALLALIVMVVSLVSAVTIVQYYHLESATVKTVKLEEYLDGEILANSTAMDWGDLEPGATYDWNYTVKNVGSSSCKLYRFVYNLPAGWNYTWTANETTLVSGSSIIGNLTLTVASDADGSYTWYSYLIGEQT